jgi:hypothetical protein
MYVTTSYQFIRPSVAVPMIGTQNVVRLPNEGSLATKAKAKANQSERKLVKLVLERKLVKLLDRA